MKRGKYYKSYKVKRFRSIRNKERVIRFNTKLLVNSLYGSFIKNSVNTTVIEQPEWIIDTENDFNKEVIEKVSSVFESVISDMVELDSEGK